MKRLTKYFLNGLAVLVPVAVTIYVVYIVFVKVDNLFRFSVPGLGFAFTIVLITLIGFTASSFITRWFIYLIDRTFQRLPFVKMIYTSVKDLIGAFVGEKKGFTRPVRVMFMPGSDISALGFITSDDLKKLGLQGRVAVYLPQSYNFAGNLIIVPKKQVAPLEADSGDVMAFIVSGGIAKK